MVRKIKNNSGEKLSEKDQKVVDNFNENIDKALKSVEDVDINSKINFIVLDNINKTLDINLMNVVNNIANKTMLDSLTLKNISKDLSEQEVWIKTTEIMADNITNILKEEVGLMKQFGIAKILFQEANEVDLEDPNCTIKAMEFIEKVNSEVYGMLIGALRKKIAGLKISD